MAIAGRIHSVESCGTVDGPGIRFVIFTQGCPLRCQYCHNPDTWDPKGGDVISADKLFDDIKKYKSYMKFSGGGVTISGGEPLLQPKFVEELFKKCKSDGIHTALDTSGFIKLETAKPVLEYTDLVLLDIKCYDPVMYKNITSVSLAPTLKFAEYLSSINKPMWIRYVLVPGLSDNDEYLESLAQYLSTLNNIEKVEVLPFHKLGEYKWEELGLEYKLKDTKEPTQQRIENAINIFKKYELNIE